MTDHIYVRSGVLHIDAADVRIPLSLPPGVEMRLHDALADIPDPLTPQQAEAWAADLERAERERVVSLLVDLYTVLDRKIDQGRASPEDALYEIRDFLSDLLAG
jgi:hypothetical protein